MNMINNFFITNIKENIFEILKAIFVFSVGWWIINKICKIAILFLQKTCSDNGIVSFLSSLLKFALRIILLMIILKCLGYDVHSIATAFGASLIAVGISLKESLSNFISGIVLVLTKPIHEGDYIEFENFSGKVMKIEMLFTTLRSQEEGKIIIIPNSKLISSVIVRKSKYNALAIKNSYKISKINLKKETIYKFLNKEIILNSKILQLPKPKISIENLDEKNLRLKIQIWSQDKDASEVKLSIKSMISKLESKYSIKIEAENK